MTPLRFLMRSSGRSPATLAAALLERGGGEGKLTGADLRQILEGKRRSPAWLHRAALELAVESGWTLQSLEDCTIAVRTFRAAHPGAKRAAFDAAMASALNNSPPPDLKMAWVQDVLKHPYAPLSAEQFDTSAAVLRRNGRLTSTSEGYARAVLVEGNSPASVAKQIGVSRQTVSRAKQRVMRTFEGE